LQGHHLNFAGTPPIATKPNQAIPGSTRCLPEYSLHFLPSLLPTHATAMAMQLLPPPEGLHCSIELLIKSVNKYAGPQGYAVRKRRSKKSKKDVTMKVWLCCDRSGVPKASGLGHRFHTSSRRNECPFEAIAKLDGNDEDLTAEDGCWHLSVKCPEHNHSATLLGARPVHRKVAMTSEVIREIEKEVRKGSAPASILTGLRLDLDEENPVFKPQDIWNARARIKAQSLGPLTPTQAVMRALSDKETWHMESKKKLYSEELEFLFFTPECMQKLLCENSEVLIMDCTYKTNKYKMPLLIITGVTSLNTSYYIAFCFMKGESFDDYVWVMEALKRLYEKLVLPFPEVILSDGDKALAPAIQHVFEGYGRVTHALCVWHINNNVLEHCKKFFAIQEDFELFLKRWKALVCSLSEEELIDAWYALNEIYNAVDLNICEYIEEHIWPQRRKFVKCYTDRLLHFNNIATSRAEGGHRVVKQRLQFSTGEHEFNDIEPR